MTAVITGPGPRPERPGANRFGPDEDEVSPTREDPVPRGLAEAVGGPLGEHAARRADRGLNAARIVMALALLVFGLHWLQKSPCMDGVWTNHEQYARFCYTDVLALYYAEDLNHGAVPYVDHAVEYPVLTGYLMAVIGLPVHAIGESRPYFNQGEAFYNLTALVLMAFGLAAIAVTLGLRRRRPWDALLFVLAPALLVTATVNWDLFAVGLTAFFMYAWARRHPVLAGVLLGLATAAKFYPLFLIGPLLVLALRSGRFRAALTTVGAGAATWALVNAHAFFFAHQGWLRFFQLSQSRAVDWGTFWYIGANWPLSFRASGVGIEPFVTLAQGRNIHWVNAYSYILFALGCLAVLVLTLLAPRRPRLAQLSFIVIALFLLTSKVWSQQFVLWLIPLAVLARPKWGAFLAWQATEIVYFLGFYGHLLNLDGVNVFPEATYVYISAGRWIGLAVLVGFVVRDIMQPERDVVWASYGDDPDGGDFVGAEDSGWAIDSRLRANDRLAALGERVWELAGSTRERVRSGSRGQSVRARPDRDDADEFTDRV